MTLPFGFGLPFLMKASFKKIFLAGLLAGIILESCQLLLALYAGYIFRFVDIDDVIYNLSGTIIGYQILFKLFKYLIKLYVNRFGLGTSPIMHHIYYICGSRQDNPHHTPL